MGCLLSKVDGFLEASGRSARPLVRSAGSRAEIELGGNQEGSRVYCVRKPKIAQGKMGQRS